MNGKLADDIETLRRTAERLQRAGLVVDRATLSRDHRRVLFALQCLAADCPPQTEEERPSIGFAYPNAR
jgi:hypothetical protein